MTDAKALADGLTRPPFDPRKETPIEYNRRWFPETVARIERLGAELARRKETPDAE